MPTTSLTYATGHGVAIIPQYWGAIEKWMGGVIRKTASEKEEGGQCPVFKLKEVSGDPSQCGRFLHRPPCLAE